MKFKHRGLLHSAQIVVTLRMKEGKSGPQVRIAASSGGGRESGLGWGVHKVIPGGCG